MPQQFVWNARYAGPDARFATRDDALALGELRVPVDTPVHIALVARDVIHSFFVPALRVKQDAIPGRVTHVRFQATQLGRFEIACAQLCGVGHDGMRAVLHVVSRDDFARWIRERSERSAAVFDPGDAAAHWGWDWVE
jgi:cytochrome c oxidase subunit 2